MPRYDHDLFVIGAGSGGVRASRMAAAAGARVAVAEAGPLGGTCVNAGCVPKKLLRYAAQLGAAFEDARGYGWSAAGPIRFDWSALIAAKDREIARLNAVYDRLLSDAGVVIHRGRARLADRHTVEVDGCRFTAERILIATGGRPFVPDVPGADLAITSDEALHLSALPERLVVIGGGYIAVELAGIFNGLGSRVTLIHRGPVFLRGFDLDVRQTLADEMAKRGIALQFSTRVERIERSGDGLAVRTSEGAAHESASVLCAVGRIPSTAGLGLAESGVALSPRGAVVVDRFSESSVPGIYAVGDVTDRRALTPVAIAEAMALVATVFRGTPTEVDYSKVPSAVFSEPEVGTVGLTEEEARSAGHDVAVYRSRFRPMLHALTGRPARAMMKLVVDRATDRVLGVHVVGPDAAEIIQGAAIALVAGATKERFDATIGVHPTAAEELVTMRTESDQQ